MACSSVFSSGPHLVYVLIWSPVACLHAPPQPCLSFPEFFPESVELSQADTSFQ